MVFRLCLIYSLKTMVYSNRIATFFPVLPKLWVETKICLKMQFNMILPNLLK